MRVTRRQFVRGGVSAFTFGFAAPQFLLQTVPAACAAAVLALMERASECAPRTRPL